MRRITIWITITLVAAALMTAYQLNTSGVGGRPGEEDRPSSSRTVAPQSSSDHHRYLRIALVRGAPAPADADAIASAPCLRRANHAAACSSTGLAVPMQSR
ncbi:MAG: hypothetical protein QOK18_5909 [Mycobacterium sp.]|jgi:hypothetical protein|nr:hypothetical protein [Mycobacterium sp.]